MSTQSSIQARLNVRVTGARDAPRTLVFSHGFGTDQNAWAKLLPGLARDFRLVLLDHAGAGGNAHSGWDPRRYARLNAFADDLVVLGRELGWRDCILVGHSAGGIIGLLAATQAPELFAKLVLIGSSACYRNEPGYTGGFNREDFVELYRLMMADYQEWIAQFVSQVTSKPEGTALHDYLTHMFRQLPPNDAVVMATAVLESDFRDWLPLITQPTLLLQAQADPIVPPEAAEYLRAHIPHCTLQMIPASGHFAFMDAPDVVVNAIRRFG